MSISWQVPSDIVTWPSSHFGSGAGVLKKGLGAGFVVVDIGGSVGNAGTKGQSGGDVGVSPVATGSGQSQWHSQG